MHFEASDQLIRKLYLNPIAGPITPKRKLKAAGIGDKEFSIDTNLKTTRSPLTATKIERYFDLRKKPGLKGIGQAVMEASKKYEMNADLYRITRDPGNGAGYVEDLQGQKQPLWLGRVR